MDDIPVLKELPPEAKQFGGAIPRHAWELAPRYYHHCDACGGWVPGMAVERAVEPEDDPQGRRGTEFLCGRCGKALGFRGNPW